MSELAEFDVGVLNSKCFCISLDNDALRNALESELGLPGLSRMIEQWCPHLFAPHPVFLSRSQQERMTAAIDLVYNRLTDFMLEQPSSVVLRQAYLDQAVVLTPHPQAHALYADKRNLALLSDANQLKSLGVPAATQAVILEAIPRTELVSATNAERFWDQRRTLFFKPTAGFGGRAAYRGDKLTKRVWQEILAGEYVAQTIVTPGERAVGTEENGALLKFDVRNYVYEGVVQSLAARLYQGQTTNFRTPGGGFAPIYRWRKNDRIGR